MISQIVELAAALYVVCACMWSLISGTDALLRGLGVWTAVALAIINLLFFPLTLLLIHVRQSEECFRRRSK